MASCTKCNKSLSVTFRLFDSTQHISDINALRDTAFYCGRCFDIFCVNCAAERSMFGGQPGQLDLRCPKCGSELDVARG